MMGQNKLEDSEQMVAAIVNYLATNGVHRCDFSSADIGTSELDDNKKLFTDAVLWLRNEGVIHTDSKYSFMTGTRGEPIANEFTLTSKGYALLDQGFRSDLTLGAAVKAASRDGRGFSQVGELSGGLLGAFIRSMGN